MSTDPSTPETTFALGRRGFLSAAAALGGTAALAPMAVGGAARPPGRQAASGRRQAGPDGRPAAVAERRLAGQGHRRATITAAIAKDLDGIIKDVRPEDRCPGHAAAVVHNGEVKFLEGYGTADIDLGNKVTPNTVFQLASVSKPLAASAVARAMGERDEAGLDGPGRRSTCPTSPSRTPTSPRT